MKEHPDDAAPHSETNPDLWVEVSGYPGKLFIMGNPHTYPGRITAWSYEQEESYYFSKDEVTTASEAARWWIDGYVHGSEPELEEYLGIDAAAVGDIADDDPRIAQWHEALDRFRDSGVMPPEYFTQHYGLDPHVTLDDAE